MKRIISITVLLFALGTLGACVYTGDDRDGVGYRDYPSRSGYHNWDHQQNRYNSDHREWYRDQYR